MIARLMALAALILLGVASASVAQIVNPEGARLTTAQQSEAAMQRLEFRPEPVVIAAVVRTLRAAAGVSQEQKATADALVSEALREDAAVHVSAAKILLYRAVSTLRGETWNPTLAFSDALTLRSESGVLDAGAALVLTLRQTFPASYPSSDHLSLKLAIQPLSAESDGSLSELGSYPLDVSRSPMAELRIAVSLPPGTSGNFVLIGDVYAGKERLTRLASALVVVADLDKKSADVERRLARIDGHADAVATIRYPFSLAASINRRRREVLKFDFDAEIANSMRLLTELEAGRDPIYRSTGDVRRAYFLREADDFIPFRIFVPDSWRPGRSLPLIVALHGAGADENNFLTRADGLLRRLAQERGYIVLSPLGYRVNRGYGAELPSPPGDFGVIDEEGSHSALSELDVMTLTRKVAQEYGVDRRRMYLMGNSMGGIGTWYLGAKYADVWAAIAPAAGGINDTGFDYRRLRAMPILAVTGEFDIAKDTVNAAVDGARRSGLQPLFVTVPGGTHPSSVEIEMPHILDFFAQHQKAKTPAGNFAEPPATAVTHVRIFDGERVISNGTVVFAHGHIQSVGARVGIPQGAHVINGAGKTLMPGLIDSHVHMVDSSPGGLGLRQAAVYGITTVLDLGTSNPYDYTVFEWRVKQGVYRQAADLFAAGPPATAPGGHGDQRHLNPTLTEPAQANRWVEDRIDAQSDYIKIISETFEEHGRHVPTLSDETIAALVRAAHENGKLAVIHTLQQARARDAVQAGVDGLVHISPYDPPSPDFGVLLATHHVFQSTNLISYAPPQVKADLSADGQLAPYMPAFMIASLKAARPFPDANHSYSIASLRQLHAAGVPILAGTDTGYPYAPLLHAEIEIMAREGGLTPLEALQTATGNPARAYRLADRGLIEPGRRADLVLVDGDPTRAITDTRRIQSVWVQGELVDRAIFRRMLTTLPEPPPLGPPPIPTPTTGSSP